MKVKVEAEASEEKIKSIGNELGWLIAAPFVGGGAVIVMAAVGIAISLMFSIIGNITSTIHGHFNCSGLERGSEPWSECMAEYRPTGSAGMLINALQD